MEEMSMVYRYGDPGVANVSLDIVNVGYYKQSLWVTKTL
jgi:hypothetical protein